jgi:hypothetical protein
MGGAMEQLRKYLGRPIHLGHIKNAEALEKLGFSCRYLPDPPEDFDEFEFSAELGGIANLGLMVTVESMAIKRMFFGVFSPDNADVVTGLEGDQLNRIFKRSSKELFAFLDYITEEKKADEVLA